MRKRIVIGIAALASVGTVGCVFWSRGPSSAYHKENYIAACYGWNAWSDEVRGRICAVCGVTPNYQAAEARRRKRIKAHEVALLKRGYLHQQTIVVSNQPLETVLSNMVFLFPSPEANFSDGTNDWKVLAASYPEVFARAEVHGTNTFVLFAAPEYMPSWIGAIRKADKPPGR